MSEQLYSIKESTLTDIGDALRRKHGETRIENRVVEEMIPDVVISKTPNATGFGTFEDVDYATEKKVIPIKISGASSIKVRLFYKLSGNYFIYVASGEYDLPSNFPYSTATKYQSETGEEVTLTFNNTDVISIYVFHGTAYKDGYYAEVWGLDENGYPLGGQTIEVEKEVEVKNTFNPLDMPDAIDGIEIGDTLPDEAFTVTGSCSYRFANNGWNWFLNLYRDKITTENLQNVDYMFYNSSEIESIDLDINCDNSNYRSFDNMFSGCIKLKHIKKIINAYPSSFSSLFYNCRLLKEVPEFVNLKMDRIYSYANSSFSNMFSGCYSLRKIPEELLKQLYNPKMTGYYYAIYNFGACYALDEIRGLSPQTGTITNNMFGNSFSNCYRLKNIIFDTQDDGTPYSISWKSQTMDLTNCVGYGMNNHNAKMNLVTNSNSGITEDKAVYDDATYQALKNDDDWYTYILNTSTKYCPYSRYNHDSAVNTINSLPDTSAYLATAGGTNTIKFLGTAGELTDGGAINTLTAEEIAVATAKGWTVTLV